MNQNELAVLIRAYDQYSNTMNQFRQSIKGVTQVEREAKQATDQLNQSYSEFLRLLGGMGVVYAFQRGLQEVARAGSQLEERLLRLRAITGELTEEARWFVMTATGSRFGPSEQANTLVDMAAAGLTAAQSLQVLPAVMDFATAAQISMAESVEATLTVLKTYQMEASQAAHITDAFTVAANKSALQGEDLRLGLAMSAAAAKLAGLSFEELLTTLSILRDAGLRASDAGTSIKSALIALMNPSKEAQVIMKELGIELYDNQGAMKDWASVAEEFERGLGGLNEKSRQYALTTIFGSDGIRAMSLTLDRGSQFVREMTRELENSDGATKSIAATMQDSFGAATDRLSGNVERMKIALFDDLRPAMTAVIRLVNDFVVGVGEIPRPIRQAVMYLVGSAGLVAALGSLLATFRQLLTLNIASIFSGIARGAQAAAVTTTAAAATARAATVSIQGAQYAQLASGLLVPAGMAAAGGAAAGGAAAGGGIAALAGPIGLLIAALAIVGPMVVTYMGHQKEVARQERENRQEVLALAEQYQNLKERGEDTSTVVQRLGQLVKGLGLEFDKTGNATQIADDRLKSVVTTLTNLEKQALRTDLSKVREQIERTEALIRETEAARQDPNKYKLGTTPGFTLPANLFVNIEAENEKLKKLRDERNALLSQLGAFYGGLGENPADYLDPNRALGDQWRPDGGPGYQGTKTLNTGGDSRTSLEIALDKAGEMIRIRDLQKSLVEGTAGEAGAHQALLAEYAKAVDLAAQNVEAMAAAHGRESEQALKATVRLLELKNAVKQLQDQTRGGGGDIQYDNAALLSVHTEKFLAGLQTAQLATMSEQTVVVELRDVTGNLKNLSPDDWAQLKSGVADAVARLLHDGLFAQGIGGAQSLLIVR